MKTSAASNVNEENIREMQRGGYESKKADKRAAKRSWEGKSREVGGQL